MRRETGVLGVPTAINMRERQHNGRYEETGHQRNGGSHVYDRNANKSNRRSPMSFDSVLETDVLLCREDFVRERLKVPGFSGDDSDQGISAYNEYVKLHRKFFLERYFASHKTSPYLMAKYDPVTGCDPSFMLSSEKIIHRSNNFKDSLNTGLLDSICLNDGEDLQSDQSDIRVLHAKMNPPDRLRFALHAHDGSIKSKKTIVTISNIPISATSKMLADAVKNCCPHLSFEIEEGEPDSKKGMCRMAWVSLVTYHGEQDLKADDSDVLQSVEGKVNAFVASISQIHLADERIYASLDSAPNTRIRVIKDDFKGDLDLAREAVINLDEKFIGASWILTHEKIIEAETNAQIDILVCYLRQVYFVCFYSGIVGTGFHDLRYRLQVDLCVRSLESIPAAELIASKRPETLRDSVSRLCFSIKETPSDEALLSRHAARVDEGRFRCVHCQKLFKGVEFVVKHVRLKHEDVSKAVTVEAMTLGHFLQTPILNAVIPCKFTLAHHHSSRSRTTSDHSHRERSPSASDRRHGRSSHGSHYHTNPPPPPPEAAGSEDPRRLRRYVDLDTPVSGDVSISYDF